jgi:hypothetical protein
MKSILTFQSEAHLGTIFTSVAAGFNPNRFKKLVPIFDSNLLELQLPAGLKRGEEFYLYCPSIRYQLYDATIQGSLSMIIVQ